MRPPPSSPPFPYTTLFRSWRGSAPPGGSSVRKRATSLAPRAGAAKLVIVLPLDSWVGWSSARSIDMERSEEHTSELQSHSDLVCRLLLEKKNIKATQLTAT